MSTPLMTLKDLVDASRRAGGELDIRTIRYYTTLGLLDRPAEMRGRTAYYGERHLQQLIAIKRLQAEGLTLGAIQAKLLGIQPSALRELAPIDASVYEAKSEQAARGSFWKERPAAAPVPVMQTLQLAPGVLLTLDLTAPLSGAEHQALIEAAQPLLHLYEQKKQEQA
jgi:DNA-binding transcriptional MerR regulator